MDNSALLNEFLIESFENLSSISDDLTQIEKDPSNSELLNKIYRTVHSMKGSSSFLGFKSLQDLAHSAEYLLDELREKRMVINPLIIDALLECFDICNLILKNLEDSGKEGSVDITKSKATLDSLIEGGVESALSKDTPESSNEEKNIEPDATDQEKDSSLGTQGAEELSSLISDHRLGGEEDDIIIAESNEFSSAAMDSLKELVDEGKIDSSSLSDLKSEKKSNEVEVPASEFSSAALESLKELVGDGKVDSSALDELESEKAMAESSHAAREQEKPVTKAEVRKTEAIEQAETIKNNEKVQKVEVTKEEDSAKKENPASGRQSIADSFVRVNVKILDKIMNIVGELVLNRNQIVQYSNQRVEPEFSRLSQQLDIITSELQSEVMSTRMQQIGSILTKFERLIRDFSRTTGKKINLKLSGEGTELDKTLIEAIKDPLVHIIRNACDHGLESIEERKAAGKDPGGTILIKSYNESGQVTIEIVDDGKGLDRNKIGEKGIEKGVLTPEKLEKMSDPQVFGLIFAAGFSTAEKITNISGRGVGMDVVKTNIEKIGGSVSVNSKLGVGTTFKLRIPLTLAIVPVLIIKSGGESFAIPQLNLVELVRLETEKEKSLIEKIQGSELLKLRGTLIPVFRLGERLDLKKIHEDSLSLLSVANNSLRHQEGQESEERGKLGKSDDSFNIVILSAEDHTFGIIVDEILDTEEIVVKPLNSSLKHLNLYGGATIMGDGKVALILDALGFLNIVSSARDSIMDDASMENSEEEFEAEDVQENLLFRLFDDREYCVPLSLVSRLEEFSASKVERTGDQPIVRYLNAPMPLINLEKTLNLDGDSLLESINSSSEEALTCIVTTIRDKNYGMIVKEILDISIDQAVIDDIAVDREGILGTVFIGGKTISLIDLYGIIEAQGFGSVTRKASQDSAGRGRSILVIDDSAMYRKLESDLLTEAGYIVETAINGIDGYDKFVSGNGKYDLILTDIEMPKLTGYELAAKIRNELKDTKIPIIALSTRFSENDIMKGRESGFNFHLEKLKSHEVIDTVIEILGEK